MTPYVIFHIYKNKERRRKYIERDGVSKHLADSVQFITN